MSIIDDGRLLGGGPQPAYPNAVEAPAPIPPNPILANAPCLASPDGWHQEGFGAKGSCRWCRKPIVAVEDLPGYMQPKPDVRHPALRPQAPSIGRIVRYRLHAGAVEQINDRLQAARHNQLTSQDRTNSIAGNNVSVGQEVVAVIVAVWGSTPTSCVNLKLLLDGNFDHWVTSVSLGTEPGTWSWPERS